MSKVDKFILENTNDGSIDIIGWDKNGLPIYKPWLTPDQARRAVEIAREELIEKMCKWLMLNADDYIVDGVEEHSSAMRHDFIDDCRKAMKE